MCGGAAPDHHGRPPRVIVELLAPSVLQVALGEVMKVCPPLKLKVVVDDITAFMEGRNKELRGIAGKVLEFLKREVEEKGVKLSITEGWKEGIGSCSYLEEKFQECSKREEAGLYNQREDIRSGFCKHENEAVRSEREGQREKVRPEVIEEFYEDLCGEEVEDGFGPCESVEGKQWASRPQRG